MQHMLHEVVIQQPPPDSCLVHPCSLSFTYSSVKDLEPRAAPRCCLPWVVMCISVSTNTSLAESSYSCFTTRYVLEALGWYPKGPQSASSFHHCLSTLQVDAPVASSANHAWFTSGQLCFNWSMSGVMARAYMAIAKGHPVWSLLLKQSHHCLLRTT